MPARDGEWVAAAAGATVATAGGPGPFSSAVIDSRELAGGELFFGLRGDSVDGGEFAEDALRGGAWGAVVRPDRARRIDSEGWVFAADDPLAALQRLATAWRRALGVPVIGITGSTGKTSVKDIAAALLGDRVHASPANYNTEIGLPLAILGAAEGTEVLVLEMAMRGHGQIAQLCRIAEPDVGVITNVGPVHIELLGTIEAIAEAKAEIVDGVGDAGTVVVPLEAGPLEPHVGPHPRTLRFGAGGDVYAAETRIAERTTEALVVTPAGELRFELPFAEPYHLDNALAAIAAGVALGIPLAEMAQRAARIVFSPLRGETVELAHGVTLINDCYNANPVSMRAALDHLGALQPTGRRLAVLGEMRELGPHAADYHREIGEHARAVGIDHLIGVGELGREYRADEHVPDSITAAEALADQLGAGDLILIKGSRAVGLEEVAVRLAEDWPRG